MKVSTTPADAAQTEHRPSSVKRGRFLWTAHPVRALLEAWGVGLLVLLWLASLQKTQPEVLSIGLFFLCGTAGTWAVLRARVPEGGFRQQCAYELVIAATLSAGMALLHFPAQWTGLAASWEQMGFVRITGAVVLAGTGAGYLPWRVVVRIWLAWDRMRRRRMRWALTHAHLMLVILAAALGAVALFLMNPAGPPPGLAAAESNAWLARIVARFLLTVFPALSIIIVFTVIGLAVMLPPSALFSYFVAKQNTRRLETLARITTAFRGGDYDARVVVAGEDEVAQLQADFNAMADTLQHTLKDLEAEREDVAKLSKARQELVASVSHELRTPVATMRAVLESAQEHAGEKTAGDLRHDLGIMHDELLRLQGLIDDLFTVARAETGGLALRLGPVNVPAAAGRMVEAMAPLAWQANRVEIVSNFPAELPPACADEGRLEQVLANLLRNAVRHTSPGGIVAVTGRAETEALVVEVRDTGEGIAAEDLPHIWERFYRGQGNHAAEGAGLGLAIVKELTEAMGGTVAVASAPGQGSCFTVRLATRFSQT